MVDPIAHSEPRGKTTERAHRDRLGHVAAGVLLDVVTRQPQKRSVLDVAGLDLGEHAAAGHEHSACSVGADHCAAICSRIFAAREHAILQNRLGRPRLGASNVSPQFSQFLVIVDLSRQFRIFFAVET
jgi:hypothetical protein